MRTLLLIIALSICSFAGVDDLNWQCVHDLGTQGSSTGSTMLVTSPALDGQARSFDVSWANFGGERCDAVLPDRDTVTNTFLYDVYVWIDLAKVNSLELDYNQVLANGDTVIFGTQCNFAGGKWQYTTNLNGAHWNDSNVACVKWSKAWHHIQLLFHRDSIGIVTYDSVTFDEVETKFVGAVGASNFPLKWPVGSQVVNVQIDGDAAGSTTAYVDLLNIVHIVTPPIELKAIVK